MRNTPKNRTNSSERDFLTMLPVIFCTTIEEGIRSIEDTVDKANRYASYRQRGIKDSYRSDLMNERAKGR